jgi:hypothetical protein
LIKNKSIYFILLFFFLYGKLYSQTVEKIKFKKDKSLIYFFQKGTKSDTLNASLEHFFYLVAPDSIKKNLSLEVENGQLMVTENDSLVKLTYLPGFQYESFYKSNEIKPGKKSTSEKFEFTTMVNGISILPKSKISISLINKKTGGLILENVFVYLNN